jgi:hypothetical protein
LPLIAENEKTKMILKIKQIKIFIIILTYFCLNSCAPILTFTEIESRVNESYKAFNENNIEYEFKNTPIKYLKEYGEKGYKKKLLEIYELRKNNKYPPNYSEIGSLRIQAINKCNSTYFYKVKYLIDKTQHTPFIDSTALALNYKEYGRKNVNFLPKVKILQVREKKEEILILDKDRKWKLLTFNNSDMKTYDLYFGKGFSKCIKSKVSSSDYLPYW